ncbi:MAG TPA: hypothetical protein VGA09_02240 [Candidatus Binatia bacterium]
MEVHDSFPRRPTGFAAEPGVDVVLTGTGNPDHLKANVEAIMKPALPEAVLRRLADIFGNVDWISGN